MTEILIPAALYAETHFRFFGRSPSLLFRSEPEIVFDLPRRLAAGRGLPVALLVNDINRFPIVIESVQVTVSAPRDASTSVEASSQRASGPLRFDFDRRRVDEAAIGHPLTNLMSAYVLTVPRAELPDGEIFVNACLRYRRVNKKGVPEKNIRTALNDNLTMSSKLPFRCFVSDGVYPGSDQCTVGDIHCHSAFSRSHVEWGPPVEMTGIMAAANGLDFAAVTDHSYDLACDPDNYLRQDKGLRLWQLYKSSIKNYNNRDAILIMGEEVSVLNSARAAVHLGALGVSEYIPGTLDGARKNIHFKKQMTVAEAVAETERQGGVSFAAHPGARTGFLQALFLNRGEWGGRDIHEKLGGLQIANDGFAASWERGKKLWVSALQRGRKLPILAGSDAHGDFNRYRAVAAPFLRIYENADRYMGFARTGVYGKRKNAEDIISGIKDGATFVTSGPFVTVCDSNHPDIPLAGSKPLAGTTNLRARASSTKEFGALKKISVIMGRPGVKEEKIIAGLSLPNGAYDIDVPIPADGFPDTCYLRIDVEGMTDNGMTTIAATSACFIGY